MQGRSEMTHPDLIYDNQNARLPYMQHLGKGK